MVYMVCTVCADPLFRQHIFPRSHCAWNVGQTKNKPHEERVITMSEKRTVNVVREDGLKNLNNLLFVGVMMAVGVVLRLCAGFLAVAGMHPNFLIATYCLSILIVRPKLHEAAIIGLISGCISQIGTSMPWVNLASETVGAIVMALLILLPLPTLVKPIVTTFLTTLASGFSFIGVAALTYANPMSAAIFAQMSMVTFVTAALNCVIVTILSIPVSKVMNK